MNQLLEQKMTLVHGDIRGGLIMSNKNNKDLKVNSLLAEKTDLEEVVDEAVDNIEEAEEDIEKETSDVEEVVEEPEKEVSGYVNCLRLNVRKDKRISGNIIGKLKEDDEVSIDLSESEDVWYKISTKSGLEGYCLKEFIDLKQ